MLYSIRGDYAQLTPDPAEVFTFVGTLLEFVPDSKLHIEYMYQGHGYPEVAFRMDPLERQEAQAILPAIPREIGSFRQTGLKIFSVKVWGMGETTHVPSNRKRRFREERE